jgi:hypothetical protein
VLCWWWNWMLFGVWRPPIFQSSNPENNHLIYLYFNPIQTNPFSCQIKKKKKNPVLVQAWNLCSPFVLHSVQVFVNLLIAIIKKKKKESFLFNNFSWSKVRRVHSISPHKSKLNLGKRTTFPFIKPRWNPKFQSKDLTLPFLDFKPWALVFIVLDELGVCYFGF